MKTRKIISLKSFVAFLLLTFSASNASPSGEIGINNVTQDCLLILHKNLITNEICSQLDLKDLCNLSETCSLLRQYVIENFQMRLSKHFPRSQEEIKKYKGFQNIEEIMHRIVPASLFLTSGAVLWDSHCVLKHLLGQTEKVSTLSSFIKLSKNHCFFEDFSEDFTSIEKYSLSNTPLTISFFEPVSKELMISNLKGAFKNPNYLEHLPLESLTLSKTSYSGKLPETLNLLSVDTHSDSILKDALTLKSLKRVTILISDDSTISNDLKTAVKDFSSTVSVIIHILTRSKNLFEKISPYSLLAKTSTAPQETDPAEDSLKFKYAKSLVVKENHQKVLEILALSSAKKS
jgi:hypothetical protein